ncbi:DNA primase [Desulfohalovibrio reitneri]|uniref:DNA primase n=1 Tax=Desulfohalovibrio reitneri TaxID=1307759 RepID=UPI00068AA405|nr:DNA primase [Desulfohalovibrio reitneri]
MGIDSHTIQELKSRLDLGEVVRRYVELKPASAGRFMGPCPFHQETKGSFSVNPEQGFYYCFGCQASGDVIDFYSRINGLEFRDAVEALAREAGLEMRSGPVDPKAAERRERKKACLEMHRLAQEYFRSLLRGRAGKAARDYLERRGTPSEVVENFGLGCSTDDWQGLQDFLRSKGFTPEQGVEAGLLSQKGETGRTYDRFRGRLIFPISDVAGKPLAFGGRVLGDGEPKYLNSSDSPIYKKGEHLYGLHQARPTMAKTRRALLTEGYMDVLSLHQFGYGDAVGVLGTSLTTEQVKRLAGFCGRIDLVFDGDRAGRAAALRSAEMILCQGLTCRVVLLPEGKDVDDVLQAEGTEGFEAFLGNAWDGLEFCMDEMRSTGSAKEVMEWAKRFLGGLKEQDWLAWYLPRLAEGLDLDEAVLRRSTMKVVHPAEGRREKQGGPAKPAGKLEKEGAPGDRHLLAQLLLHPERWREFAKRDYDAVFTTEWARRFWEKVVSSGAEDVDGCFHLLDEAEKRFVGVVKNELPSLGDEEREERWNDCGSGLERRLHNQHMQQINTALREAAQRGDQEEVERLFLVMNELCGRIDEQPEGNPADSGTDR